MIRFAFVGSHFSNHRPWSVHVIATWRAAGKTKRHTHFSHRGRIDGYAEGDVHRQIEAGFVPSWPWRPSGGRRRRAWSGESFLKQRLVLLQTVWQQVAQLRRAVARSVEQIILNLEVAGSTSIRLIVDSKGLSDTDPSIREERRLIRAGQNENALGRQDSGSDAPC
jgi:hypothetical protein